MTHPARRDEAREVRPPGVRETCDADQGVIRVRIRDLRQLFDSLDPSPFLERDLDGDMAEYVESCAAEIPRQLPLRLVVHITDPLWPAEERRRVQESVRNHYVHQADLVRARFRKLLSNGRISLVIGLGVLTASLFAAEALAAMEHTMLRVMGEGLVIGGWVAMWRPMEILLYDWWPLRRQISDCERLAAMQVEVVDED